MSPMHIPQSLNPQNNAGSVSLSALGPQSPKLYLLELKKEGWVYFGLSRGAFECIARPSSAM